MAWVRGALQEIHLPHYLDYFQEQAVRLPELGALRHPFVHVNRPQELGLQDRAGCHRGHQMTGVRQDLAFCHLDQLGELVSNASWQHRHLYPLAAQVR
jgi:hypothetical protein